MDSVRKTAFWFPVFIVAIITAIMVFSVLIPYPGELWSEILHQSNHAQYQFLSPSEKLDARFSGKPQGGMTTGYPNDISTGLLYAYSYDAVEGVYYYRFRNVGKTDFCFSSKLLPPLIGKYKLYLSAGESKYVAVYSKNKPTQNCALIHLWENCKRIHSTFAAGSCIIVPEEK